jgi:hypothetical protein
MFWEKRLVALLASNSARLLIGSTLVISRNQCERLFPAWKLRYRSTPKKNSIPLPGFLAIQCE